MISPTWGTWVWASSRSWWTGRPGVPQSMGSQRVRPHWVTELNWTISWLGPSLSLLASVESSLHGLCHISLLKHSRTVLQTCLIFAFISCSLLFLLPRMSLLFLPSSIICPHFFSPSSHPTLLRTLFDPDNHVFSLPEHSCPLDFLHNHLGYKHIWVHSISLQEALSLFRAVTAFSCSHAGSRFQVWILALLCSSPVALGKLLTILSASDSLSAQWC